MKEGVNKYWLHINAWETEVMRINGRKNIAVITREQKIEIEKYRLFGQYAVEV